MEPSLTLHFTYCIFSKTQWPLMRNIDEMIQAVGKPKCAPSFFRFDPYVRHCKIGDDVV